MPEYVLYFKLDPREEQRADLDEVSQPLVQILLEEKLDGAQLETTRAYATFDEAKRDELKLKYPKLIISSIMYFTPGDEIEG